MDAPPDAAASSQTQHLDDAGRIIDELPVELQPKFTVQDEQRDLATLTIQELIKLQSDLTGIQAITKGFSGLGLGGDSGGINVYGGETTAGPDASPPSPLSANDNSLLATLDQHMTTLPAQSTAAYFMATTICPDQVSNERKLLFLECEESSITLAAERLALYWQYRLDGFGEDRCFEPMTLARAMRGEVVNMAKSGIFQLMPKTDAAGRAIIYVIIGRRDYSLYSVKQEVMWLTYLLEIVVQQKSLQSRGFVLLVDTSNGTGRHRTRQSQQYLQRAMNGAFPIRMCSLHIICNVNSFFTRVIFPVMKRLSSKRIRLRTRLHRDSGDDLLRSLATFHLPPDRLPSDMGGSVVLDINQFLIDRLSLEALQAGICLPTAEQLRAPDVARFVGKRQKVSETNNVDQANRIGTTLSSAASYHSLHEQASPNDVPSAGPAAAAYHSTDASSNMPNADADADNETTSTSITEIAATGTCAVGGRQLPLSSPSDEAYLSPLVCLIRSQIEIFSATEADVHARAALGGVVQTIRLGRVGIRCIHCWDRPAKERANGAVSYPASIRVLNQAVRNWQRFHWGICPLIPPSAREKFERLNSGKKTYSSKRSKEYWIHLCEEMGLVDVSATMLEDSKESEGIYFEADARALGLRVLMISEEQTSGAARKKVKGTTQAGTSGKRKKGSSADSGKKDATSDKSPDDEDVASILLQFAKRS